MNAALWYVDVDVISEKKAIIVEQRKKQKIFMRGTTESDVLEVAVAFHFSLHL